ncbi:MULTISPECIES: alanine/glycine:cation symporter family protein [Romboutsia]|uniref:Amino-acid carrier protein AlsT n=1 Tax=Romboutsia hominis TaxID=1507512 RepID=A0A2P2BSV4_9FIRM|nr:MULTISPECIES: alanine/glycine:cation symporter family protein [Romboutsia]MCH1960689.1 alanine:cation symporter family protein [Romboutsia hominis]MCH1968879.1 alanine:cation symporter family protein [Romboutsia hominis]MDB8791583.1 alanine/glycine:cation symporter family protein [Romboutsia sp. 1001216sp1]MDB8793601.1 alanine/glycine:cation symporter family protein [Romboutsia sp. 1001216sp1]MDB8794998.1 alanine/glycine:cation symporter family protein [Romboutsia sp. 1001216sp1]
MENLNSLILSINDFIWTYILIAMLVTLGIYFSVKTKFVQFRYFKEMFKLLGEGASKENKKEGQVSSFQAFCISTSSRVGTGNIAGIAMAVVVGGPGAIFWMWITALIGSASSFVESTLAQIFKIKDKDGFRGGPAYYIEQGLNKKWMGILFSILITICFGFVFNAVQANTVSLAFNSAFGIDRLTIGIIITILTAIVIFGGVHRIAKVSEIIVPIFAGLYILVALFVVVINIGEIPNVLKLIVENAFNFREMSVGTTAGIILTGVKRGLFSNEAGMGSAPNAAATADTSHPVKQGLIQTLGVFTDTILICTCTAFIVLLYPGYSTSGLSGIELTQAALSSHIGSFAHIFIALCIFLFAFSSIVGNYYYGESNIEFMNSNKTVLNIFRVLVVCMVLFGSVVQVDVVWNLADVFMALMAIINLIAIALLGKYAFIALEDYTNQKKNGIKSPVFDASNIKGLENVQCWNNTEIRKTKSM